MPQKDGTQAKAIPAEALSRGRPNYPALARKIRALDENDTSEYLKKLKSVTWAWFQGNRDSFYTHKKVLQLRKYLKLKDPELRIPTELVLKALQTIDLGIRLQDLTSITINQISYVLINRNLLIELVDRLNLMQTHFSTGQQEEMVIQSSYTVLKQPILHKRIRALFP